MVRAWASVVCGAAALLGFAAAEAWAGDGAAAANGASILSLSSLGVSLAALVGAAMQAGKLRQQVVALEAAQERARVEREKYSQQLQSMAATMAGQLSESIKAAIQPAIQMVERDVNRMGPQMEQVEARLRAVETGSHRAAAAIERVVEALAELKDIERRLGALEARG